MKIYYSLLSQIPPDIYKKLYSLNFRNGGQLRSQLIYARSRDNDQSHIVYMMENDMLLGWGLAYPNGHSKYYYQCYVRKSYRRQGIGSRLFNKVIKKSKLDKLIIFDNDSTSKQFYKPFIENRIAATAFSSFW